MIDEGIEPASFLNDLLEIIYSINQKKNIGDLDLSISDSEKEILNSISENISTSTLIIFWQLILKVIEELSVVSSQILSLEMLIVRLVHIKDMPSYESILDKLEKKNLKYNEETNDTKVNLINNQKKFLQTEGEVSKISKDQIKNITQTKEIVSSFPKKKINEHKNFTPEKVLSIEDLIALSSKKKEVQLKYDLENSVNLIRFSEGKIDISFNENLDKNFVRKLSEKLFEWTGSRWVITLTKEMGQKTFSESQNIKRKKILEDEKKGEIYKKIKNTFSDAELLEVKKED